ncbi:MAG: hypothetical protein ACRDQW_07575 [Haloechinothrix sp.]
MSIGRKDDRHNADLVDEIADGFSRAIAARPPAADPSSDQSDGEHPDDSGQAKTSFVITGDQRFSGRRRH